MNFWEKVNYPKLLFYQISQNFEMGNKKYNTPNHKIFETVVISVTEIELNNNRNIEKYTSVRVDLYE